MIYQRRHGGALRSPGPRLLTLRWHPRRAVPRLAPWPLGACGGSYRMMDGMGCWDVMMIVMARAAFDQSTRPIDRSFQSIAACAGRVCAPNQGLPSEATSKRHRIEPTAAAAAGKRTCALRKMRATDCERGAGPKSMRMGFGSPSTCDAVMRPLAASSAHPHPLPCMLLHPPLVACLHPSAGGAGRE